MADGRQLQLRVGQATCPKALRLSLSPSPRRSISLLERKRRPEAWKSSEPGTESTSCAPSARASWTATGLFASTSPRASDRAAASPPWGLGSRSWAAWRAGSPRPRSLRASSTSQSRGCPPRSSLIPPRRSAPSAASSFSAFIQAALRTGWRSGEPICASAFTPDGGAPSS